MARILIVASKIKEKTNLETLGLCESDNISVLLLANDEDSANRIAKLLEMKGINNFEVLHSYDYLKEAAYKTRDKYVSFIGEWPDRFCKKGRNFKEIFTYNNDLSLWWLTTFAMKNPFKLDVFNTLCRAQIVADIVKSGRFNKCVVLASDRVLSELVRQICEAGDIKFMDMGSCAMRFSIRDTVLWFTLSRLRFLVEICATKLVLHILEIFGRRYAEPEDKKECAIFMTLYLYGLNACGGIPQDRFYGRLPDVLENSRKDIKPLFMPYLYGSYFSSLRLLLQMLRRRDVLKKGGVVFLERYLKWREIFSELFDWRISAHYLALDYDAMFRNSFSYNGINIFRLVRPQLRESFLGSCLARCLLTAKGYERFIQQYDKDVKFTFSMLEFYNVSRAIYYISRRSFPRVKTIAYQHALILPMDSSYYFAPSEVDLGFSNADFVNKTPLPDYIILQGEIARQIITSWGYPAERCILTGSPRYDGLSEVARRRGSLSPDLINYRAGFPKDKKIAVIATSHLRYESCRIIETVAKAISGRDDIFAIFKPHPVCPMERIARGICSIYNLKNYRVVNDDIGRLISIGDVFISTYSTAATEAFAAGMPVISLSIEGQCIMDVFSDTNSGFIMRVKTAQELNKALDELFSMKNLCEGAGIERKRLVEDIFYRLDGLASERIVKAIEGL